MRKSDVEKARNSFLSTGVNTSQLKAKIQRDLDPVRNAYEIAVGAWDQLEYLLKNVPHEDKPTKAMRDLAAAMKDIASVMTSLRGEARETAQFHSQSETSAPEEPPEQR